MMVLNDILVSTIPALIALVGVIITVQSGNNSIRNDLRMHNAVQDEKIETLTREVRKHNGFAERIPKIEERIENLKDRVDSIERKN